MEFEKAYRTLNTDQKAAVDYLDGPLLVIAGPGTGKTQLLSVRVANILKQTDTSPENILCLTYTDAAASNMRSRLTNYIGADAYKVPIHTYHSLGALLLSEHHPELNSAIDALDQFTLIRNLQSRLPATDLLRPDHQTKAISDAINELKSATITPDILRTVIERNVIDAGLISSSLSEPLQRVKGQRYPIASGIYQEILAALQSFVKNNPQPIFEKIETIAQMMYRELLKALLAEEGSDKPSTKAMGAWRERWFEKDDHDNYVVKGHLANKKLRSLADLMDAYQKHLRTEGLFDYADMILMAIDLLEHNDAARFNAQERFQYLLLDEFQDTNDAQAKLVALLTDNPANNSKPNIMAVGDDDQAIYGFQGANSSNFFDFDARYHPKQIFLTKNYRSSAPILEFAHNIIEQSTDRFCKSTNVNINKRISAANPPKSTNITLSEYQTAPAEYTAVARSVKQLLDQGTAGPQIAILAPKHKHLLSILPFLHALDIPVSYERRENILDDPAIANFLHICQLILKLSKNPRAADPYWLRALAHPNWQIKPATVLSLIEQAKVNRRSIFEEMATAKIPELSATANFLADLATKVEDFSAEYIISTLCTKLYPATSNPDFDFLNFYSNLNTLRDLLRKKSRQSKIFLRDLLLLTDAYQNTGLPLLNQSPYHESNTAVRLETVHSAKGLEYNHVFLIACDDHNWSNAGGNNDKMALTRNLEFIRHTGDSAPEKIRIFFVAITRARATLHLSYSLSDFAGHTVNRLKYLDEREITDDSTGDKLLISKTLPDTFQAVALPAVDEITPQALAPDHWLDVFRPTKADIRELLHAAVEHYRLSPTHLLAFIDLAYNGPDAFLQRYLIHAPGESSFALDYGKYIHEVMDELNKEQLKNEIVIERFNQKILGADADENAKNDLKTRGDTELSAFLAEKGDFLRQTPTDSELDFSTKNIFLGEVPIRGKIDRVEHDDAKKQLVVADFKTSKARKKWGKANRNYQIQLYFYKFLLENSHDYPGYRVKSGRIDYIQPDPYGKILSLPLDFNEKTAARYRKLITAVYRHIKALDFPDTTKFLSEKDPTSAFIDALIAEVE